jgi:hypothetical protein
MDNKLQETIQELQKIEASIYNSCSGVAVVGDSLKKYRLVQKIICALKKPHESQPMERQCCLKVADYILSCYGEVDYDDLLKGCLKVCEHF